MIEIKITTLILLLMLLILVTTLIVGIVLKIKLFSKKDIFEFMEFSITCSSSLSILEKNYKFLFKRWYNEEYMKDDQPKYT